MEFKITQSMKVTIDGKEFSEEQDISFIMRGAKYIARIYRIIPATDTKEAGLLITDIEKYDIGNNIPKNRTIADIWYVSLSDIQNPRYVYVD